MTRFLISHSPKSPAVKPFLKEKPEAAINAMSILILSKKLRALIPERDKFSRLSVPPIRFMVALGFFAHSSAMLGALVIINRFFLKAAQDT